MNNINIQNRGLEKIDSFSNDLEWIKCCNNKLVRLPQLPNGLLDLWCNNNKIIELPQFFMITWFGMTVCIMIAEHFRRINILELPKYLTLTWVLYRIIALVIILNI